MSSHALRTSAPCVSPAPLAPQRSTSEQSAPGRHRSPLARLFALLAVIVAIASLGACTGPSNNSAKGAQIVNMARSHIGAPYVWGASGPSTFDCSGLVQYVHGQVGISVPRTTYTQLASARPIPPSAALPGDVIFIGNFHVGIYVGGGQMIDAPKTGDRVKQEPIWYSGYTVGRFW